QVDSEARLVDRDRLAVAVDQPPAARRDWNQLDAVALGKKLVLLVLGDREPAHSADQEAADGSLATTEQHHPAREGDRLMRSRDAHVLHRPSLFASMRKTMKATTGNITTEMTSAGTMRANGGAASSSLATRHCSHSSIAISNPASTH